MKTRIVGKRIERYDGLAHVVGETKFVDDFSVPGALTVKVLRSPVCKGRILNLDVSAAEKGAGVAGVIMYRDVPHNAFGFLLDQPVLVEESIRFRGEPIAAVAAADEDTAWEAIDHIRVDIEEEEAVLTLGRLCCQMLPRCALREILHIMGIGPTGKFYSASLTRFSKCRFGHRGRIPTPFLGTCTA